MPSTKNWWETPIPSVSRPPDAAWAVSAAWASTTGWRGWVATTAVPSSTSESLAARAVMAPSASTPSNWGNHSVSGPSAAISRARAPISAHPPVAWAMNPTRIAALRGRCR